MDPPTLDVAGVTIMAETHAHLVAFTYARRYTYVHTMAYTLVDRKALHPPAS